MKITEAIKALEAAREVLGDDSHVFVTLVGADGFTAEHFSICGPIALADDPGKKGVTIAVHDPRTVLCSL